MLKLESLQCDIINIMAGLLSQTQRYGKRLENQTLCLTGGPTLPMLTDSSPAPSPRSSPTQGMSQSSRLGGTPETPASKSAGSAKRVASQQAVNQLKEKRGKIEAKAGTSPKLSAAEGLPAGVVKDPVTGVLTFDPAQQTDQKEKDLFSVLVSYNNKSQRSVIILYILMVLQSTWIDSQITALS